MTASSTTTAPLAAGAVQDTDQDDLTHVVCCEDEDLALCGKNVSDMPWTDDDDTTDCQLCAQTEGADCHALCPVQALRDLRQEVTP